MGRVDMGIMEKIQNRNCDGLCSEMLCGNEIEYFTEIEIKGVKYILECCEEHANQYDTLYLEKCKELEKKEGIPIIPGYQDGPHTIIDDCPFCGKSHHHGNAHLKIGAMAHWRAHCLINRPENGYYIKIID